MMKTNIDTILEELVSTTALYRMMARYHLPSEVMEDISQDLLLSWKTHPSKLIKAYESGWHMQYISKAIYNRVCKYRSQRIHVSLDTLKDKI